MANVNSLTIIGRLTKDPEIKSVGAGQVCRFAVAVGSVWKDAQGERKEETTYFDCDIWGKAAEAANSILHKASSVYVRGEMRSRKDDQGRIWWSVRVDNWQALDSKQSAAPNSYRGKDDGKSYAPDADADLPF